MKRLIKKKLSKIASSFSNNIINLPSGDVIIFTYTMVNYKPWYKIYQDSGYSSFSYYDGPNYDDAVELFSDLLTVFKGVRVTEDFKRQLEKLKKDENKVDDAYPLLKSDNRFLGMENHDMI